MYGNILKFKTISNSNVYVTISIIILSFYLSKKLK